MFDKEIVISLLKKMEYAIERILSNADEIDSVDYYLGSAKKLQVVVH